MSTNTPKTVWAVEHGDYSDYRVLGVFTTKRKAELAQKLWKADCIAEWILDAIPEHPKGMMRWEVSMDEEGNVSEAVEQSCQYLNDSEWSPDGDGINVSFHMWAKNEKHAIKVANERRIALKASEQWTTCWHSWRAAQDVAAKAADGKEASP